MAQKKQSIVNAAKRLLAAINGGPAVVSVAQGVGPLNAVAGQLAAFTDEEGVAIVAAFADRVPTSANGKRTRPVAETRVFRLDKLNAEDFYWRGERPGGHRVDFEPPVGDGATPEERRAIRAYKTDKPLADAAAQAIKDFFADSDAEEIVP